MPIAFQGGLTGSLFREFALTLAGAVAISGVVALTLSPMMSAALLKRGKGEQRGLAGRIDRGFDRLRAAYARRLDGTLRARRATYAAWGVITALTLAMFTQVPRELAPTEDQGVVFGILDTPANSTLDQLTPFTKEVSRTVLAIPESQFTFQITFPNGGFWGVGLDPWGERERTAAEILPEVQAKVSAIPGIQSFAVLPPALPGGGSFPVEVVLASTAETTEILGFARQLQEKAVASGMFAFPPLIDMKLDQPSSELEIDREKVAELGLDLQTVAADVAAAVGGGHVNRFSVAGRSYKVIPQLQRAERLNPQQLEDLHVTGPDGRLIALSSIARLKDGVTPRSLNRFQQLNAVKISGVAIRPLDQALGFLEAEAARILPEGYTVDYTGESRQLRTEGNRFLPAFLLAVVLIFLVLAAQFDSFRDPLVIVAGSVPLAMFGAVVMMFLKMPNPTVPSFTDGWTTTLNVYSQVGLVTLVGLVAKNGILIVEFANRLQDEGRTKLEAVRDAAITRLRPILMTSVATVFGHLPLTFVTGPGAEARNSIGLVLVAGMAVGTTFTLFILPALYVLIAKDRRSEVTADDAAPHESDTGLVLEGPLHVSHGGAAARAALRGEGD
jgi:multidrug efflux pump